VSTSSNDDHHACTPLVDAIRRADNGAVRELLQDGADVDGFVPLDDETRRIVRMQGGMMSMDDIAQTEQYVGQSFGGLSNFERTPLLEACRHGNADAIRLLIEAGAKLNAKDALGETALSLCLYDAGPPVEAFMDECIAQGVKFSVDDYLLGEFCREPPLYRKAIEHGRLSAKAKHFQICLSCALLDADAVTAQLDQGYKINAKRPFEFDPLREAVSSESLRTFEHPRRKELAPGDAQVESRIAILDLLVERGLDAAKGNPCDPFPLLGDIISTNAPAILEKVLQIGVRFDPAELHEDASIQMAIQCGCFEMVAPLVVMGCPHPRVEGHWQREHDRYLAWCKKEGVTPYNAGAERTAQKPPKQRISFEPGCKAIRRSPWNWQLLGESTLMAAIVDNGVNEGGGTTARLTYSNVYCPIDGIELRIRLAGDTEWTATELVEEIVDQDGDILFRSMADEIVGEAPWDGTFEAALDAPAGQHRVEISVRSPAEGIDEPMVIDDWQVEL